MIVEINATESELKAMIDVLANNSTLSSISTQLEAALANNKDTESDEIPEEGDNAIIKRME